MQSTFVDPARIAVGTPPVDWKPLEYSNSRNVRVHVCEQSELRTLTTNLEMQQVLFCCPGIAVPDRANFLSNSICNFDDATVTDEKCVICTVYLVVATDGGEDRVGSHGRATGTSWNSHQRQMSAPYDSVRQGT